MCDTGVYYSEKHANHKNLNSPPEPYDVVFCLPSIPAMSSPVLAEVFVSSILIDKTAPFISAVRDFCSVS